MLSNATQEFISRNGEWTAMAVKLSDGTYTRSPAVDHRLRRLLQCAQDTLRKPIADCRVLDLACLEGHYAIEFALHGAQALGIEARQVNLDKCNYAKDQLHLQNVSFAKDDVRNLSRAQYGTFDVVICSGILYHLPAADAVAFIAKIGEVCSGILLIDTFVSISGRKSLTIGTRTIFGHDYFEHRSTDDTRSREERLWASIDNTSSFWLTEATLVNLLMDAGFTSVVDVLSPTMPGNSRDRKTYLACRGLKAQVRSSDPTRNEPMHDVPEGINKLLDPSQIERGWLFTTMKHVLPPTAKDVLKPLLRALRILPPDTTPEFMRKRKSRG
jgi:2-polyprenyl-3-methyl-5-hydroxy-6-metoxy-1,4-benzoquinol methylase